MQVFKTYFKILRRNFFAIGVFIAIFAVMAAVSAKMNPSVSNIHGHIMVKTAIINHDEESPLITGFTSFLEEYAILIPVEDDKDAIQEAIFDRRAEYIITIPSGFSESMLDGTVPKLEVIGIDHSRYTTQMNMLVDKYLNLTALFLSEEADISPQLLNTQVMDALEHKADVTLLANASTWNRNDLFSFNFLAYVLLASTIAGITAVMSTFNRNTIYRRNISSPLKLKTMNMQIILGNFCLALVIWAVLVTVSVLFSLEYFIADAQFFTVLLNSFVLLIVCISIGSLAGLFTKTEEARAGVTHTVSLIFAFLGGVFIEQRYLGDAVNQLGSFTPVHWYVRANDLVRLGGGSLDGVHSDEIAQAMWIQLLFALTFLAVAVAYSKAKRKGTQ